MASAHPLTDHDEIRQWAEERGARPACVRGTGGKGDPGMIRIDMPGYSGKNSLQEISWDEWFRQFDDNKLALMVQDQTARGQKSNFNKIVSREAAEGRTKSRRRDKQARGGGRKTASRRSAAEGRSTGRARKTESAAAKRGRKKSAGAKRTRKSTTRKAGAREPRGRESGARKTARKTEGRKTAGRKTAGRKTAGRKTAGRKTAGARSSRRTSR